MLSCIRHFFANNSHRYASHPAYDFSLGREVESPNILVGVRMGNYHQLSSVHLTPTADVAVSKSHEVNGAIEFRLLFLSTELSLDCITLNARAG